MSQKRKRYDRQFKVSAARALIAGTATVRALAEELGIDPSMLRRWAGEYRHLGDAAFPGNGRATPGMGRQLAALRKKAARLEAENGLLRAHPGLLGETPGVRFAFIKEHRDEFVSVGQACEILEVSRSGFYEYLGRRKSKSQVEREALDALVAKVYQGHRGRYGYRRIRRELCGSGTPVSDKRVLGSMRRLGIQGKGTPRKYRRAKAAEKGTCRANLVNGDFDVAAPNRLWVGDITYLPTCRGWLYLAVVVDAFNRKVIGWSVSDRITEKLAIEAIRQAAEKEAPPSDGSLVFHDDQGSQYTSKAFRSCLEELGITQSMSRPGTPWDNPLAESFFKTLKRELVGEGRFEDKESAKQQVFEYIELYYNERRMHSAVGYKTPNSYGHKIA